jgi:hypothetical protein
MCSLWRSRRGGSRTRLLPVPRVGCIPADEAGERGDELPRETPDELEDPRCVVDDEAERRADPDLSEPSDPLLAVIRALGRLATRGRAPCPTLTRRDCV